MRRRAARGACRFYPWAGDGEDNALDTAHLKPIDPSWHDFTASLENYLRASGLLYRGDSSLGDEAKLDTACSDRIFAAPVVAGLVLWATSLLYVNRYEAGFVYALACAVFIIAAATDWAGHEDIAASAWTWKADGRTRAYSWQSSRPTT